MFFNKTYASNDTISIQNSETIAEKPEQTWSGWTNMLPMILIFIVFYFLLIRPQEKRRRQKSELVNGVKKGERILTNSGIFGMVTKINDSDNTVDLEIAKDIQIKILKSAIADIISRTKEDNKKKKDKGANSERSS